MELWMKLLLGAGVLLMLFYLWPVYKHWSKNSPEAQPGDWQAVILPLLAVIGFVVFLVALVR